MTAPDPKRRLLDAVARHPVPPRSRRATGGPVAAALAAAAMLAAYAAVLAAAALSSGRGRDGAGAAVTSGLDAVLTLGTGTAGRPGGVGLAIVAGFLVLAAGATWIALPARRSMLSPARGPLLAVALGVPLLIGAWLLLWGTAYVDPYARVGWRCIELTAATAPWPLLAVFRASRRLDPRHPALTGAALGAAAGAWGAVMAASWCPLSVGPHVLFAHVLPVVLVIAVSAAAGSRWFGLRRA